MASLKKCVENMCKSCTYDATQAGSWRHQVENCSVKSCALWEVRPVTMETQLSRRKDKNSIDTLVAGLEDDDEMDAV